MSKRLRTFLDCLLRGYGQLFATNRLASGGIYAAALFVAAPGAATLGLLAAALATALALRLAGNTSAVRCGLFGVQGVLLSGLWAYAPEAPWTVRLIATSVGVVVTTLLLHASAEWFRRRNLAMTLFSIPYVLVAWCTLLLLGQLGSVDRRLLPGWDALGTGDVDLAAQAFANAQPRSAGGLAYQADGLGWTQFRQGNYPSARESFERAIDQRPQMADAWDGLGWTLFRLGEYANADEAFRRATALDPWLADSWNGRGWLALGAEANDESRRHFARAAWSAPLCADAYAGQQQAARLRGDEQAEQFAATLHAWARACVPRRDQWTTLPQCCAWLLLAAGIAWHSRWSALAALGGVGLSVLVAARPFDAMFLLNLAALNVALAGHYLRPGWVSTLWAWSVSVLLALAWPACQGWSMAHGWPLLCAPFNVGLLGSLLVAGGLQRLGLARLTMPLEVAVTSPARARVWVRQRAIAERCWRELSR